MSYLSNVLEELRSFDVSDLSDFESIGVWPGPVKAAIVVFVMGAGIAAGYFFHIKNLQADLEREVIEETIVRTELEEKAFLAANLEEYRAQTEEMERSFAQLLRQLPSQTEVPGLVDDITNTGLGSGLEEFSNIELSDEVAQEFYIELPIEIDTVGGYHDFATFVSGVAALPRIVTLHDFKIVRQDAVYLQMSITAKTYRYKNEDDENNAIQ